MHRVSVSQNYCIDLVYSNSLVGGSDYQEIVALNLDVLLTFNDANRQHLFDVTITDDSVFEFNESFILELGFDPFALEPPPLSVILSPNTTTVDVMDNEGIIIILSTLF